ncbi:helix-turn-helix transcriptional regulator [Bacillus licheniformis]|jgi:DNA-binding Xre family transcriptional regulator|uniref:helix-turn-helix domain-containing protein n=1 Tax=Bacillus subtilis group TaxID=653685 RepID=UPI0011A7DD97|nr:MULTISPECIES: helix-turn-helix transcriptional regulator [Bacillus subtilis group]MBU8759292.1 helix-turn-helix transcriptional regulator [Bacillus paralicheniformis]MBZ5213380.1 helix-turn-helix transcriptional regulator [Bacillus paralicheniformis]MCA1184582.1 helix-turn-helix transcriptional regulator [Bacillus licheniformis]MCM3209173.1 helix-turn-helix transcriptional regulator [Bacillus licheniformis]MCM3284781.1 helix-turn-helix transcriptional regulator [Bacillus licheniformis]
MGFRFNLNNILDELEITKNKLAVEAKVRPATIGDLCDGKTKRLELETIEKILNILNEFSHGKSYTIDDIILYEPE